MKSWVIFFVDSQINGEKRAENELHICIYIKNCKKNINYYSQL